MLPQLLGLLRFPDVKERALPEIAKGFVGLAKTDVTVSINNSTQNSSLARNVLTFGFDCFDFGPLKQWLYDGSKSTFFTIFPNALYMGVEFSILLQRLALQ